MKNEKRVQFIETHHNIQSMLGWGANEKLRAFFFFLYIKKYPEIYIVKYIYIIDKKNWA